MCESSKHFRTFWTRKMRKKLSPKKLEAMDEVALSEASDTPENVTPDNLSLNEAGPPVQDETKTAATADNKPTANITPHVEEEEDENEVEIAGPSSKSHEDAFLEIGTIHLRLNIPNIIRLDIPIPRTPNMSSKKWALAFYDQFRGKFWIKIPRSLYKCLVCGRQFRIREGMLTHLNHHLGFKIARCRLCLRSFYSLVCARKHTKICNRNKMHRNEEVQQST